MLLLLMPTWAEKGSPSLVTVQPFGARMARRSIRTSAPEAGSTDGEGVPVSLGDGSAEPDELSEADGDPEGSGSVDGSSSEQAEASTRTRVRTVAGPSLRNTWSPPLWAAPP